MVDGREREDPPERELPCLLKLIIAALPQLPLGGLRFASLNLSATAAGISPYEKVLQ